MTRLFRLAFLIDLYGVHIFTLPDSDSRFTSGPSLCGLKTLGVA